ncbi:MAG: hypothetical protein EHM93_17170 [Bacteroidales bacterium]|nr:MAG: hypothetical protein EHM93_17170 [Bacteroidales bacterium]
MSTFGLINSQIINNKIEFNEALDERAQNLKQIQSKIELLLNPTENDSKELLEKMNKLRLCAMKDIVNDGKYLIDYRECYDEIIRITQKVLKTEWERVKKGI